MLENILNIYIDNIEMCANESFTTSENTYYETEIETFQDVIKAGTNVIKLSRQVYTTKR